MVEDKRQLPSEMSATTKVIKPLSVAAYMYIHHTFTTKNDFFFLLRKGVTPTTKDIGILFPDHLMLDLGIAIDSKKLKCLPQSHTYVIVKEIHWVCSTASMIPSSPFVKEIMYDSLLSGCLFFEKGG